MRVSAGGREKFWADAKPTTAAAWPEASAKYRASMWDNLIGRYPPPSVPPNARTRVLADLPVHAFFNGPLGQTSREAELFVKGEMG